MGAPSLCSDMELAFDAHAQTGESPTWSEREQALYWIDVEEPALHRFDPKASRDESWKMPSQIGAFALCRSGAIVAALRTGLVRLRLDEGDYAPLCQPPYNPLRHRFNDGKCDASGRFWVGTMHDPLPSASHRTEPPAARLHVFTCGEGLDEKEASAVIANGLAWSPDSRTMYFADTPAGTIWAFNFDLENAGLSSKSVFAQFSEGRPDGAAVDNEGFYWCAMYGSGCVIRLSPDGELDRQIELPISQPTMCAFGDADYGTLYVTTASHGVSREREPHAGAIFRCRPGVTGLPASLFADR